MKGAGTMSEIQNEEIRQYSLKELRARKNETQAQAAEALGVTVQTYNAWEKSLKNIAIGRVLDIAAHFGVGLCDIKL